MNKTDYSRWATTLCGVLAVFCSCGPVAKADCIYGEQTKIPNVSRPGAGSPQISRDGLELYFLYVGENPCGDIWVARRGTTKDGWGAPVRLDPPVNDGGPRGGVCISADGLELYFGDGWPRHNSDRGCQPNPNGYGNGDLWVSTRTAKDQPWGNPQNLGPEVNSAQAEDHPSISADGLSLYFTSDRSGSATLWVTTRTSKAAPWGPPVMLSVPINMPMFESTPFISPDGLSLYFSYGQMTPDIYVSKRTSTAAPWGTPVVFLPVYSPAAEYHLSFSAEDSTLYFTRADTFFTVFDLWQVEVTPIVDFNGDRKVDLVDLVMLINNWGTNKTLCDIGPMPWGDGKVDIEDLKVFMTYYEKENPPAQL